MCGVVAWWWRMWRGWWRKWRKWREFLSLRSPRTICILLESLCSPDYKNAGSFIPEGVFENPISDRTPKKSFWVQKNFFRESVL